MNNKLLKSCFVEQHDFSDCGPACLLMIVRYYGGDSSILHLREISGTSNTGTTLLGLCQAAESIGFNAKGVKCDSINELQQFNTPCIISIIKNKAFSHYVVCFGFERGVFVLCDPASGILYMKPDELDNIWTQYCLFLNPNASFSNQKELKKEKKEWLRSLIRKDLGLLCSSLIMGIVSTVLSLSLTLFSRKLIDDLLPNNQYSLITTGLLLLFLVMSLVVLLNAQRGIILLKQRQAFNNRINNFFLKKIINLPKIKFDNRTTGEFLTRLGDTSRIQSTISSLFSNTLIDVTVLLVNTIVIFWLSWIVGLFVMICSPIVFLIVYRNNRETMRQQKEVMVKNTVFESGFVNTISGISDIKSFQRQEIFFIVNSENYKALQKSIFVLGHTKNKIGIETGLLNVIIQVGLLAFCSYNVMNNNLTVGTLTAILGLSSIVLSTISSLASFIIPINEAKVAFQRMFDFLEINEPGVLETTGTDDNDYESNTLVLNNVSFRHVGRKPLLNDICLSFNKGSITCIVGESGYGKSTLCQIIERFYKPSSGKIFIDDIDITSISLEKWHNLVSYIPQEVFLYNGTVIENILFGKTINNIDDLISFCNKYGFTQYFNELPNGLLTLVGEAGINLSGGQKQLVAFARALFKPSKIIILDEITSAMDRRTETFVCNLLRELKKEHIIIFVTHRLEVARLLSDKIVVLEYGQVTVQGKHNELMESENYYSQYWNRLKDGNE